MELKILVDIREIGPRQTTGIGRFVKNFLDNLEPRERENILLIGDSDSCEEAYHKKFRVITVKNIPVVFLFDQLIIPFVIAKEKIDVFFSPYYKIPFFASSKKIITIHDLYFLDRPLVKNAAKIELLKMYLHKAVIRADKIITVSEYSRREITRLLSVPEGKVRVVYNAVSTDFSSGDYDEARRIVESHGIRGKYILYVGNMLPHKNLKCLLYAYSLLEKRDRDTHKLVIVAKIDRNLAPLRKIITSRGIEDRVLFIDFLRDADLAAFYKAADVFVFPSLYEGFGLPPIEAMASGTVVVAADIAILREVLGDSALFTDPLDAQEMAGSISGVLHNQELRETLRQRGLLRARLFSAKNFSDQMLKEIKGVI